MPDSLSIAEMHRGIRLGVQQVDANFLDGLLPEEIDFYLNETIREFVKARYSGRTADGRGFEQSEERVNDLRPLFIKDAEVSTLYAGSPVTGFHVDRAVFPENYLFLVSHRSAVQYQRTVSTPWPSTIGQQRTLASGVTESKVFNRKAQSDHIYRLLEDPYNTTWYKQPLVDVNEDFINVYTDEHFVVTDVILNYVRKPAVVDNNLNDPGESVDCDLPGHVHNEIVRMTVRNIVFHLRQLHTQQQS